MLDTPDAKGTKPTPLERKGFLVSKVDEMRVVVEKLLLNEPPPCMICGNTFDVLAAGVGQEL